MRPTRLTAGTWCAATVLSLVYSTTLFATEAPPLHAVRIPASAKAWLSADAFSAARAVDYGRFVWAEITDAELAAMHAAGAPVEVHNDAYTLTLGEQQFDPVRDGVPAAPEGLSTIRDTGPDLHLVQFRGPIKDGWVAGLEAGGAKVVQYIHPFTYVVWAEAAQIDALAAGLPVRWRGDFLPAYRLLPSMRGRAAGVEPLRLLVPQAADVDAVVAAVRSLGGAIADRKPLNATWALLGIEIDGAFAEDVARIPGVYSVQTVPTDGGLRTEMSGQICVGNVDGSNAAFPGYLSWLSTVGLSGAGVIIANVDGGVRDSHPDLTGRMIPCVGGVSCGSGSTESSHGTHTAGIMAGDGASGVVDSFGFLRGLGIAPGANLVEQRYSPTFTSPGGMLQLMTDSVRNNASLSGNSWGPAGTPRGYDNDTLQCDIGVRDADPDAAGNQSMSYVLSFMNGNGGTSSQGTPDEGKNLFTIGSTKQQNSGGGSQILQIDDLSANSAHGPALDGRTIPHMVAPGCQVDSTDTNGAGYGLKCGTSMASPQVSGGVALFIEYYRGLPDYTVDPSPALVKAAFIAVARNLAGNRDADGGILGNAFDSKQGWGRMELNEVVDPQLSVRYWDNPVLLNNTGEEWTQTVSAEDPNSPVRIMLVWTDAPGHGLGGSTPAWNNNLDLIVEDGGSSYRGNNFGGNGFSISGGTADDRNNTEGVFIGPAAPGAYTIRVVASNINSDGVPAVGDATDQDFAVVCYNCALEPGFTLGSAPTDAALCGGADAEYSINVGQILGFTDAVTLSVNNLDPALSATFATNPVVPAGSSLLTISNTGAVATGEYDFEVVGTSGSIMRTVQLSLQVYADAPAAPTLRTPANGADGVALRPLFTWDSAADAAAYTIEVATDAGFSNIVASAAGIATAEWQPGSDLALGTPHYWRVRAENSCGVGANSATWSFTTRVVPAILLVDDDDNGPNVRAAYADALAMLGQDFDVWDTNNTDNEPNAADLSPYRVVIWFTGDEFGGVCGPGSNGESALATWLDDGNNLLISSQDYHYDRQRTPFMADYLGAAVVNNDVDQASVTGQAGSIFEGLGPYTLSYPFTDFSDRVTPDAAAVLAFVGNNGNTGIHKDSGVYKTIFCGFPLEALAAADRQAVIGAALAWFLPGGPLLGDANCDGVVSVSDVGPFVLALTDPMGYAVQFPDCDPLACDLNDDGFVTVGDIGLFVALITGG